MRTIVANRREEVMASPVRNRQSELAIRQGRPAAAEGRGLKGSIAGGYKRKGGCDHDEVASQKPRVLLRITAHAGEEAFASLTRAG